MMTDLIETPEPHHQRQSFIESRGRWVVLALLTIGVGLLVIDHWAHALGVLPYLILLACPLMHFFMHGGHGHRHHHSVQPASRNTDPPEDNERQ